MAAHPRKALRGRAKDRPRSDRRSAASGIALARDHGRMVVSDPRELAERIPALPGGPHALAAVQAGSEHVYLVGGAVRDLALGAAPADLDLVVVGDAGPLAERLAVGGGPIRAHGRFGTATVQGPEGVRYDLASTRTERYPRPGALPEVTPAPIRDDLTRRDFTVNALALGLNGPDAGHLLAVPDGIDDLKQGQLRVLHAASFLDDPTRLLRLARYAGRLGFAVEPSTAGLAREAVVAGAPASVSGARLGAELQLLSAEADPLAGFEVMRTLGLDAAIAPRLGIDDPEAVRRALAVNPWDGPPIDEAHVVLAAALLGVPEPERRPLLDRLGVDASTRREVLAAAAGAPALARRVPTDGPPSRLLQILPADQPATIALAAGLGSPSVAAVLARWFAEYSLVRLEIDGSDLITAGVPAGPAISTGLRAAHAARLDGAALTREQQLAVALAAARGGG
jgi:tRNA nucleotidyltransferase (CCA-adding enzyme)